MAITIEGVRLSYCNLFQPQVRPGQTEAKYSVTVLVPKSNTQAKAQIDAAVNDAITAGVTKCWNGQRPPMPAVCVHDGDGPRPSDGQPFGEECRNCWVFTASSKSPPFVVDAQVQNIIDPNVVYSGMWGNVNVNFFPYNSAGKKGVGCGLNGVQKTGDGDPLANRVTAEEAFKVVTPAAQAYQQPAQAYQQPAQAYQQPAVNPITGQPYAAGMNVLGM